jgi:hypothetical protein
MRSSRELKALTIRPEEMPEAHSQGKNLIGTSPIEIEVKLLILRRFDLLADDTSEPMAAHAIVQKKFLCTQQPPATFWSNCAGSGYNMRLACVSNELFC